MTAKIRFLPSGHEFIVERNETILEAALRAGLSPKYRCDKGSCGECRARLISGDVVHGRFHDYTVSEAEKHMGIVLLCSIMAKSDLVIETIEASSVEDIPLQQVMTRVTKIERPRDDIMVLSLRTPRTRTLRFLAGQHARLSFERIPPRPLSIASCPCNAMNLQFHIRRYEHDPFSDFVFNELKPGDTAPLQGPLGEFVMDESSSRPMVFIAYGTGFAPIRSLIEHAISLEISQPIRLLWVAHRADGHYMHNYCRSWADALDNFTYTPLLADKDSDGGPPIETGAGKNENSRPVTPQKEDPALRQLMAITSDLNNLDIYICGPEVSLQSLCEQLTARGLPLSQLHFAMLDNL